VGYGENRKIKGIGDGLWAIGKTGYEVLFLIQSTSSIHHPQPIAHNLSPFTHRPSPIAHFFVPFLGNLFPM
jgi:hypothetical protein